MDKKYRQLDLKEKEQTLKNINVWEGELPKMERKLKFFEFMLDKGYDIQIAEMKKKMLETKTTENEELIDFMNNVGYNVQLDDLKDKARYSIAQLKNDIETTKKVISISKDQIRNGVEIAEPKEEENGNK